MSRPDLRDPATAIPLGAPGVYVVPQRPTAPPLGVPMDECAFVGVAPRGPAWEAAVDDDGPTRAQCVAVAVRSWDDYRRIFGGFEGPGLLPLAVSAFFEQGGRVAHVVRVVPRPSDGRARLTFEAAVKTTSGSALGLIARNEGSWGRRLTATISFTTTILPAGRDSISGRELNTGAAPMAAGAVLRITTDDGAVRLRVVELSVYRDEWFAVLSQAVSGIVKRVELVEGVLDVVDADPGVPQHERFEHVGLMPAHPHLAGAVVGQESRLAVLSLPDGDGIAATPALLHATAHHVSGGVDRYHLVTTDDVLGAGVPAALAVPGAASLCVPDLYSHDDLPPLNDVLPPVTVAGAEFDECHPLARRRPQSTPRPPGLAGLRLDPADPLELARITELQLEVVRLAEAARVVALLDVPRGLRLAAVHHWRRHFASSYAAAYHPWVLVPRDGLGGDDPLVPVPPSAVAAGVIARTELQWGVPHGPANETANGVPGVRVRVVEPDHGELHWSGVNVFTAERRGVVLTGARTLSTERMWRQLTARRVVTMVERAVAQQLQWVVFEPNDETTRTVVATALDGLLMSLFRAGAFRAATPAESFFVRTSTDRALAAEIDSGQLLCEIGVAPTEPMEFLLVRVYREGDATLRTESRHG